MSFLSHIEFFYYTYAVHNCVGRVYRQQRKVKGGDQLNRRKSDPIISSWCTQR